MEKYLDMVLSQVKEKSKIKKALWTADGRGRRKNQGWDNARIRRSNELVDIVRKNRGSWPVEYEVYLQRKGKRIKNWKAIS